MNNINRRSVDVLINSKKVRVQIEIHMYTTAQCIGKLCKQENYKILFSWKSIERLGDDHSKTKCFGLILITRRNACATSNFGTVVNNNLCLFGYSYVLIITLGNQLNNDSERVGN